MKLKANSSLPSASLKARQLQAAETQALHRAKSLAARSGRQAGAAAVVKMMLKKTRQAMLMSVFLYNVMTGVTMQMRLVTWSCLLSLVLLCFVFPRRHQQIIVRDCSHALFGVLLCMACDTHRSSLEVLDAAVAQTNAALSDAAGICGLPDSTMHLFSVGTGS